jgi:7SK snRNA methylphosphate capping enzyme
MYLSIRDRGTDPFVRFSVTKWVHLNGGDTGLRAFFHRIHDVLRPGGTLVLEPQEWASYNKAWRMDSVWFASPMLLHHPDWIHRS